MRHFIYIYLVLLFCLTATVSSNNSLAVSVKSTTNNPISKKLRVLSIDGGGVRGIIPARILQEIEEQTGRPISDLFDLVVGNSTGGLVTLALLTPDEQKKAKYKASDLVAFYKDKAPKIFRRSWWRDIKTGWGLWGPKYNRKHLDHILKELVPDTKLSQTLKPALVVSYSLDQERPHVWTTLKALQGSHPDYYLHDIAGATSAAPTYFSPKVLQAKNGSLLHEVDGALWANNPECAAIPTIQDYMGKFSPTDILLVSVGTGNFNPGQRLRDQEIAILKNAGAIGWVLRAQPNIIDMMIGADSEWAEALISALYPHNYRIQVYIPQDLTDLDNSANVPKLEELAEDYIKCHQPFFKKLCEELTALYLGQTTSK